MNPSVPRQLKYFELILGRYPAIDDLEHIVDQVVRARLQYRIHRAEQGTYGDHRRFGDFIELIANFGPGHRIYLGEDGPFLIVILVVGDKSTQGSDFREARAYWDLHKARKKKEER